MVSDGIGNTEKACISKHFLVSGVTCRCRIGSTPKRKVARSNRAGSATTSEEANCIPLPLFAKAPYPLSPSSFPNRTHFVGLRFGFAGASFKLAPFRFRLAAKTALCSLVLPLQIEPTSLGFDLGGCQRISQSLPCVRGGGKNRRFLPEGLQIERPIFSKCS